MLSAHWFSRLLLSIPICSMFLACAHHQKMSQSSGRWGNLDYKEISRLYFTGQPDKSALTSAKKDGVSVVINLRTEAEMSKLGFNEAQTARELGITYYNIPFDGKKSVQPQVMAKIEKLVKKHHSNEKILLW